MTMETPTYIKQLLIPNGGKQPQGRKVWSIDLQQTWLPFFTATNTVGNTQISFDALGYPIRLALDKDGSVRFNKSGRPVTRVVKELSEHIRMVRDNFVAGLISYAKDISIANPDEFTLQVQLAAEAGQPMAEKDNQALVQAQALAMEKAIAEAETMAKVSARRGGNKSRSREAELVGAEA